jgi:hypothetical protein
MGSAVGSSTVGIFALGCNGCPFQGSTTRDKYTYSGCVVSSGAASSAASLQGSAAGNATVGIFSLGAVSGSGSTTRNKYTYSGDTNAVATASSNASSQGSAASNGTTGVNI